MNTPANNGFRPARPRHRWMFQCPLTFCTVVTGSSCGGDRITSVRAYADPSAAAISPGESLASVHWNAVTQAAIARNRPSQNAAWRQFAYVALAQHVAIEAVAKNRVVTRGTMRGAVAGASETVLTYLFPNDASTFETETRAQERSLAPGLRKHFIDAESVGREVAASIVTRARNDRFDAVWTDTIPVGPGKWSSLSTPPAPPLLPLLGEVRPVFMKTGNQFRSPPPPAFGSPAFLDGLAEVRRISDTRTAVQDSIAKFWAFPTGSLIVGYWNTLALELIDEHKMGERAAAHALALMNAAGLDANIACHDAKYAYWFIRPSAADPAIKLAVGLPNHPSYPSNHAGISATAANVLAGLFPTHRERLLALANEAAISRIYGGIHYRFDADAGMEIARKLSALALDLDRRIGLAALVR